MNEEKRQRSVEAVLFENSADNDALVSVLLELGLFANPVSLAEIKETLSMNGVPDGDVESLAKELFDAHRAAVPDAAGTPVASRRVPRRPPASNIDSSPVELSDPKAIHKMATGARAFAEKVKGKHIVGFLGVTGVGKTTFMRYLLGHRMALHKYITDGGHEITVIDSDVPSDNLVIGHEKESQTQEPFMERAPAMGDNVYLVDLPGDFDTSMQTSVLLRHALTKAFVLRNAASVRLVMMLSCEVLSVKRGASVEDDLADVLNLFPDSQTQSCMLTLVSPVGRDSLGANLRNLTEQSTIGHIRSIRCEVEGLTRGRECTQTTSFFTKLNASLHETELALQAGRAPTSPICYAANPLRGDELDTVRRFVMSRPACSDRSFNVAIPSKVSDVLLDACRRLLDRAVAALNSLKSSPCDDLEGGAV